MITANDIEWATELVRRTLPPTPTFSWPLLDEAIGTEVWVKHENHSPVGAFKLRGGLVFVDRVKRHCPGVKGLVLATRGNHGQSIAYAGVRAGLGVTVVVPHGNSEDKNAAMRALGAEIIEHGGDFQDAREHAAWRASSDSHLELVPSFCPELVLGVATYAHELFSQAPPLHTVYVPVGMGSGICGLIAIRDLLALDTEIVGVVSDRADAVARSFAAGGVVETPDADTFVDGVATRCPDVDAMRRISTGAARILAVSEDATARAMRLMFATTHNLPEPAGAIALAGLQSEAERMRGRRVGMIHTGGNVDAAVVAEVMAGGTPKPPSAR